MEIQEEIQHRGDSWETKMEYGYRQPSLYAVFLSEISRICDPEMAYFLEHILWITVSLAYNEVHLYFQILTYFTLHAQFCNFFSQLKNLQ